MTDYDVELVTWLRDFQGSGSNGTNEAADTIEKLQRKLDAVREERNNATQHASRAQDKIDRLRDEARQWIDAPADAIAPSRGVGHLFLGLLDA